MSTITRNNAHRVDVVKEDDGKFYFPKAPADKKRYFLKETFYYEYQNLEQNYMPSHFIKCMKCNTFYRFINSCTNCGHDLFQGTNRGKEYKSLECSKCGEIYEFWVCEKDGCRNPFIRTFYIRESDGCFIATAVYGSFLAPEVQELRKFRDDVLLKSTIGRFFVHFYYFLSPSFANIIANHEILRKWVGQLIVYPTIKLVRRIR